MMDWLKYHSYLSGWIAIPVAIIAMVYQNRGKRFTKLDWSRTLIYLAFLISLAVTFTPMFDAATRDGARTLVFAIIGFLIVDRVPRK